MAGLKPGRTCRQIERPWTRTAKTKVKKAFVRGVPDSKVRAFDMGELDPRKAEIEVDLIADCDLQMRDNSLEAARVMANKHFEKKILKENYYFKIRPYPHQCLREHSILCGAGADRLSSGMRKPFGRPIGRAVIVHKGDVIMSIYTLKKFEADVKIGLYRAAQKMPGAPRTRIIDLATTKLKIKFPPVRKRKFKETETVVVKTGPATAAQPGAPAAPGTEKAGEAKPGTAAKPEEKKPGKK